MNCNPVSLPKELAAQTGCNDLKLVPFVDFTDARNGGQSNCIGVVDQRAQNSRLTAPGHALLCVLSKVFGDNYYSA